MIERMTSSHSLELRAALGPMMAAYRRTGAHPHNPTFADRMAFQRLLNDARWAAPGWPERFGGRGLTIRERLEVDAELAAAGAPLPAGVLGLANVGPALIDFGTPEQQRALPAILDGTVVWCQGFSEPDAGSDLAHLRTTARIEGDEFVVNGQKIWTSNGMEATHCMLLARTDPSAPPHKGISAILVPMDTPGISRRPITMISGDTEFAEVFFTDVRVPRTAVLGPLHQGWRVTTETLKHERAGVLSRAAALSRKARDAVADVVGSGRVDELHVDELMRRYLEARVLGLLGEATLRKAEQGVDIGAEQALIKLAWGLIDRELAQSMFDAEGLPATAGESPHRTYGMVFTKSSTIAAGTTEILKNLVAERVLALPR
jgi:alkylation response protein AidB-like acyl-CoA dehydrogenase